MSESPSSSRRSFLKAAGTAAAGLSARAMVPASFSSLSVRNTAQDGESTDFAIVHEERFDQGLQRWQVEQQPGGTVALRDGQMVIDDEEGCTVWFREKLQAPYIIEYTVTPSTEGRVSDVNCFWMAMDPRWPDGLLAGGERRHGAFTHYDPLRTYYVGMGGHDNTTTRFRRYPGDGSRPMAPAHDRSEPLLTGDRPMRIRIVADGRRTQYIRDGEIVFDVIDAHPLTEGWFGLRTVNSHLLVDDFRVLKPEIRMIQPEALQTGISYYNTTPESPDGRRIAYVRWKEVPQSRPDARPAELWVCTRDRTNHRKVLDIEACTNHNGARVQWTHDTRVAYMDGSATYVADVDTGERVHGPYPGRLGHHPHDGRVLIGAPDTSDLGPPGVYEIDAGTGDMRPVVHRDRFEKLPLPDRITPGPKDVWDLIHLQYSPSGTRIAMRFDPMPDEAETEAERLLVTFDRNGGDMVLFGPKLMHFFWYDDETVMGHENPVLADDVHDLKVQRWTRTGELVETLAGAGNHLSVTEDRVSYASETWYGTDPVALRVYARGDMTPAQHVFSSTHAEVVWEHGAHVNPAFGRDGSRLYFNYPARADRFQAAYVAVLPTARTPRSKASSV